MTMKKFLKRAEKGDKLTQDDLNTVYTTVDKAKKVGLIKPNTAARRKSRATRVFNTQGDKK